MLSFGDLGEPDLVYVEYHMGAMYIDKPELVARRSARRAVRCLPDTLTAERGVRAWFAFASGLHAREFDRPDRPRVSPASDPPR